MEGLFPKRTEVNKIMPKEAFYKKLTFSNEVKSSFVSDIKKIVWTNKFSKDTLNIEVGKDVAEILVLEIEVKKQDINYKILEAIAKQNSHKILFILKYEDLVQVVVFYKKIYRTSWDICDNIRLEVTGLSLDEVWDNFVEQIVFGEVTDKSISTEEKIIRYEEQSRIHKEIEKLEKEAWKEKQPKRKFELVEQINKLKKKV